MSSKQNTTVSNTSKLVRENQQPRSNPDPEYKTSQKAYELKNNMTSPQMGLIFNFVDNDFLSKNQCFLGAYFFRNQHLQQEAPHTMNAGQKSQHEHSHESTTNIYGVGKPRQAPP